MDKNAVFGVKMAIFDRKMAIKSVKMLKMTYKLRTYSNLNERAQNHREKLPSRSTRKETPPPGPTAIWELARGGGIALTNVYL